MIISTAFASTDECSQVASNVYRLRMHWLSHDRGDLPRFYTLGMPSYIATSSVAAKKDYYLLARTNNSLLMDEFGWLYDRLADIIQCTFGSRTVYVDGFARPGFHIFPTAKDRRYEGGGMHLDLQYRLLDWREFPGLNFSRPISFTVAISLPEQGGGMNIYKRSPTEFALLRNEERARRVMAESEYIQYEVGSIVIQDGLYYHEIAQRENKQIDSDRITLQGHGLLHGDHCLVYW